MIRWTLLQTNLWSDGYRDVDWIGSPDLELSQKRLLRVRSTADTAAPRCLTPQAVPGLGGGEPRLAGEGGTLWAGLRGSFWLLLAPHSPAAVANQLLPKYLSLLSGRRFSLPLCL